MVFFFFQSRLGEETFFPASPRLFFFPPIRSRISFLPPPPLSPAKTPHRRRRRRRRRRSPESSGGCAPPGRAARGLAGAPRRGAVFSRGNRPTASVSPAIGSGGVAWCDGVVLRSWSV